MMQTKTSKKKSVRVCSGRFGKNNNEVGRRSAFSCRGNPPLKCVRVGVTSAVR